MYRRKINSMIGLVIILVLLIPFNSTSSAQGIEALTPLKIVQLGDSYSAGNGARCGSGERNYNGVEGCYRSPTNWGSQYAELSAEFVHCHLCESCLFWSNDLPHSKFEGYC